MQCPLCEAVLNDSFETARKPHGLFWRCDQCDLVSKDPRVWVSQNEERRIYDLHQNGDDGHRLFLAPVVEAVARRLSKTARGLDWGSGPVAVLAQMLNEKGYSTATYDPVFEPREVSGVYDFVTLTEVIEHFKTPSGDLERIRGHLKPGGFLFVLTACHPGGSPKDVKDFFEKWGYRGDPTHVSFFSAKTFRSLEKFGWAIDELNERLIILRKI